MIDHVNLAFHEAGHIILGLFSSRLEVYGGTLNQLLVPFIVSLVFLKQGQITSFAIGMIWFFENFFNIARYMADARAHLLPLVGGGMHDWTEIFSRWGVLNYDVRIANFVKILGWLGIFLTFCFVFYQWLSYKRGW